MTAIVSDKCCLISHQCICFGGNCAYKFVLLLSECRDSSKMRLVTWITGAWTVAVCGCALTSAQVNHQQYTENHHLISSSHWQIEPNPIVRAEPHIRSCLLEHPIDDTQLERLKYADFADGPLPQLQCILHCFFERAQFYDASGQLNAQRAAYGLAYPHQLNAALGTMNVCRHLRGANACDTAYQVFKCFKQAIVWQSD